MRISDWSSDVCASDLTLRSQITGPARSWASCPARNSQPSINSAKAARSAQGRAARSAERRVGKECVSTCRSRWSPYHYKKNPVYLDISVYDSTHDHQHEYAISTMSP